MNPTDLIEVQVRLRDPEVKPGDDCPFCGERVIDWGGVKHVAVPVEGKPYGGPEA